MKALSKVLAALAVVVTVTLVAMPQAHAHLLEYNLGDHPFGILGSNKYILDANDYGLRLDYGGKNNTFSFVNVKLKIDTTTGVGAITGTVEHLQSGDLWEINSALNTVGFYGTFNSEPLPNVKMVDDLHKFASIGYDNSIVYDDNTLVLSPVGAVDPVNGYDGPTDWVGKSQRGFFAHELLISYRDHLDPAFFPGNEWNLLVGAGWWMPANVSSFSETADFQFVVRPVPEPATMTLLGLGMAGMGFVRRRFA